MRSMICPNFVDHLVFRVSDLDRAEGFYSAILGEPSERTAESVMYTAGDTRLFFTRSAEPRPRTYRKEEVGLNHVALGVRTLNELEALQAHLDSIGISHSGITVDRYGKKEFIWLDDPDGMRIEFYLRPG